MIDIRGIPELRAAAQHYGQLEGPVLSNLRKESKAWSPTLVRTAVLGAKSKPQGAVAVTGRTSVTGKGLIATFGSGRTVRYTAAYEFGSKDRGRTTTYMSRHRTSRKAMRVTRRTRAQLPPHRKSGYFIFPAVADTTPELVGRWVRAIAEAVEAG